MWFVGSGINLCKVTHEGLISILSKMTEKEISHSGTERNQWVTDRTTTYSRLYIAADDIVEKTIDD